MAAPTLPQTDPVAMLTSLLSSGGTKSTTNPGDTSLLQQTFANTQAIDPQALLQSIFQQGAAQIPGLQAAYGNAVGARRSGNSAIQNALNQLLAQTTLQGQNQIMTQQQNLLNTQAQVGGAVANATKGTKSTTGTPNVASSAKNLLMLQGLAKLANTDIGKSLLGTAPAVAGFTGPIMQQNLPTVLPGLEQYLAPQAMPDFTGPLQADQATQNVLAGLEQYLAPVEGDAYQPAMDFNMPDAPLPGLEQYLAPTESLDPLDYFFTE